MTIYGGEFWFINQQRVKVVNDGVKKKGNPFFLVGDVGVEPTTFRM